MVRVVSQQFSRPRSRHSSGETDLDLAMRADSALSTLRAKRNDFECFPDYESSSDSFWDSELDTDQQDHQFQPKRSTDDELNGNETSEKSDIYSKRKERRRERNKMSAQAYRQRRRQVNVSTQQELNLLEERNRLLLKTVEELEQQTEQAKQFLKGQLVSVPSFLFSGTRNPLPSSSCDSSRKKTAESIQSTNQSLSFSPLPSHPTSPINNSQISDFQTHKQSLSPTNCLEGQLNANSFKHSPVNLNALAGSSVIVSESDSLLAAPVISSSQGTLVTPIKPKHLFNANHWYKIPMHQQQVLRTVHEIPSPFSEEDDKKSLLSNQSHIQESSNTGRLENVITTNTNIDGNVNRNSNINLNSNNMNERRNKNLLPESNKIWNGAYHMNALEKTATNDNDTVFLSKSQLQNTSQSILYPKSFYQLIISSPIESAAMPTQ